MQFLIRYFYLHHMVKGFSRAKKKKAFVNEIQQKAHTGMY